MSVRKCGNHVITINRFPAGSQHPSEMQLAYSMRYPWFQTCKNLLLIVCLFKQILNKFENRCMHVYFILNSIRKMGGFSSVQWTLPSAFIHVNWRTAATTSVKELANQKKTIQTQSCLKQI